MLDFAANGRSVAVVDVTSLGHQWVFPYPFPLASLLKVGIVCHMSQMTITTSQITVTTSQTTVTMSQMTSQSDY